MAAENWSVELIALLLFLFLFVTIFNLKNISSSISESFMTSPNQANLDNVFSYLPKKMQQLASYQ
jgi:YbbR domain-containing protein